jgi:hypothetical protein
MPEISKQAKINARSIGVNLCEKTWFDQPKFDPGRKQFHLEHVVPVSNIRDMCLNAKSEQEVLEILDTKIRLAWITKHENSLLTKNGTRSNRPDPDKAYQYAGISLTNCQYISPYF